MIVLPKSWIERFEGEDIFKQLFSLQGTLYREKEGRKTLRFSFYGKYYFAKIHRGVGWKEIIKNLSQLRMPVFSAQNEWNGIKRLDQFSIKTMRLVGYGKRGWNPARLQSFVIMEELENTISLEELCKSWALSKPSYALKRALIIEVAKIARTLHENGMNHRDFYICHFLLDVSNGKDSLNTESLQVYLIDLHRMKIMRKASWRNRAKDIAALYFSSMDIGLTKQDVLRFIRIYQRKPLRETLYKERFFWWYVKRRAISLYRKEFHREPTVIL
ncbi:MAG: lipopolysaccharide core heptose(I) kinase RfaP [Thermodesulfobacteriota bacterium]|nr:lipopolysaccharide core heptose(I) kinase RfaP [Thermodesulfobacteriota bacterium]